MRRIAAFIASLLFASPALAAWTTVGTTTAAKTVESTTYTYSFTTATDSGTLDLSACGANSVTFEQSTGDASTVAAIDLRACASSTDTWQACTVLKRGPENLPDTVATSVGAMPTAKPYALVHVATSPTGGDTARVTIVCSYDSTATSLGGDVVGPASATPSNVALFDGTTGKLLKDGGALIGASDVQNQQFVPVTDPAAMATFTRWDTNATTTYDTIKEALDSLGMGLTAAWSAWTGQYDWVVDVQHGIRWHGIVPAFDTNTCLLGQIALNDIIDNAQNAGVQSRAIRVAIVGSNSGRLSTAIIPATDGFIAPGGEARRCWSLYPSKTYVAVDGVTPADKDTGFPVGDANAQVWQTDYTLHFDVPKLNVRNGTNTTTLLTGVTQPFVVLTLNNGYGAGIGPAGGNALGGLLCSGFGRCAVDGNLVVSTSTSYTVADTTWGVGLNDGTTGGRPFGLPLNVNAPPKGIIGMFVSGAGLIDLSRFNFSCAFVNHNVGETAGSDTCTVLQQTGWDTFGDLKSIGGTGIVAYGNVQGGIKTAFAKSGKIGIQLGDPYIGGDVTTSWFCTNGFTVTTAGTPWVSGDVGQAISWTSGETGIITAVPSSSSITYRMTATDETSLASARFQSGNVTCTGCNGGAGTTAAWASQTAAACGRRTTEVQGFSVLNAPSLEGNVWGNVVMYDAYKVSIANSWIEQNGTNMDRAPSVLIGAGSYYGSNYQPCWSDLGAGAGSCVAPPEATDTYGTAAFPGTSLVTTVDIRFLAGNQAIAHKLRNTANDETLTFAGALRSAVVPGLAFGPGAIGSRGNAYKGWGKVYIGTGLTGSDINPTQNDSSANCSDTATVKCAAYVKNAISDVIVDLSQATWRLTTAQWPAVKHVTEAGLVFAQDLDTIYAGAAEKCVTVRGSELTTGATDDNHPIYIPSSDAYVMATACRCTGTCSVLAADITFEDSAGNAMTGTPVCTANTAAFSWTDVTAGGQLTAGDSLQFDVGSTAAGTTTDLYTICAKVIDGW